MSKASTGAGNPVGAIAIFTETEDRKSLAVVYRNEDGLEVECRLSPTEAFKVSGQIFLAAIMTSTRSRVDRVRGIFGRLKL